MSKQAGPKQQWPPTARTIDAGDPADVGLDHGAFELSQGTCFCGQVAPSGPVRSGFGGADRTVLERRLAVPEGREGGRPSPA